MSAFDLIAFDADDTLWYSERFYSKAQEKIYRLLAPYGNSDEIRDYLNQIELENLRLYGYGTKGFALSMIEAVHELSGGRITSQEVQAIIEHAKDMLTADIQLFEHVSEVLPRLANRYRLAIITKGDLFEQESKVFRSGLKPYFQHVEVVSQKNPDVYSRILEGIKLVPERFVMVGNSLRSDVRPVLELGGHAVYIPCDDTWFHEAAEKPAAGVTGFYQIEHMGELSALLACIDAE